MVYDFDSAWNFIAPTLFTRTPNEASHFFEEQDIIDHSYIPSLSNNSNFQQPFAH